MSALWTPRVPANLSLTPAAPLYAAVGVEDGFYRQVAQLFGVPDALERMDAAVAPPLGYYRLQVGGRAFFLKVLQAAEAGRQKEADRVARFVAGQGFLVSLLQREIALADGLVALVYDYIGGRFPRPDVEEAAAMGLALARMHDRLATAPMAADGRAAGLARLAALEEVERDLREGNRHSAAAALILRLSGSCQAPFREAEGAQMVHGDLNLANLLVDRGGTVGILDFEDSLSSWLPPLSDVAMVLQRMVLCAGVDRDAVLAAGAALLRAYGRESGRHFGSGRDLQAQLLWLSLRSLCLLTYMEGRGRVMPEREWDKFAFLAAQAEGGLGLFDDIVRHAAR